MEITPQFPELVELARPVALHKPDPAGNIFPEAVPSVKIEYKLATGGPVQKVHLFERDGPARYRESWIYSDGAGEKILALRQADAGAGDQGDWVGSGLLPRSDGLVSELHESWFYTGNPESQLASRMIAAHPTDQRFSRA